MIKFDQLKACIEAQCQLNAVHLDAGESAAFARELESISATLVEEKFPEYKALSLVPVKSDFPAGADLHTWQQVQDFGKAAFLSNLAPENFPTTEVKGSENVHYFRSIGDKYIYSIEDLRRAAMTKIKPDQQKARAARKAVAGLLDLAVMGTKTGTYGSSFKGLLHDDMSQDDTASAGTPDWETGVDATDVGVIAKTFATMADNAFIASKGAFDQFDFVITVKCAAKLGKWVPGTVAGLGKTVQDFLLSSVPRIRSISVCDRGAGQGAGGKERILAYPRSSEVFEVALPIEFESFAPQLRGMAFEVYNHAKYGGIRQYHPYMFRRCDVTVT